MKVIAQHLFLTILCLTSFLGNAQTEFISQDFPSYESVVKHFIKNYEEPSKPQVLHFEKRPEGYFVSISSSSRTIERTNQEILWSNKMKSFQSLQQYIHGGKKFNRVDFYSSYFQGLKKHEFDFCPFSGYPGWQRDVMKYFENEPTLPDSLLYGLGRAYSTFVGNMIYDYSGATADTLHQFNLPNRKNAMTPEQLKIYRKYTHLAQKAFLKLHEQNPDFETFVGKPYIKYSNEVMWNFLQLQYLQNNSEANKELMPGLYDKFYINGAKNYLNSCPPNAILFTYGDNDTYPLLYIQAQLKYRTDVLIVNLSLINVDRYINHIREGVFNAAPFPLTFAPSFYAKNKNNMVVFPKTKDADTLELNQMILDLEKGMFERDDLGTTIKISMLPTNKFYWNVNLKKTKTDVPKNLKDKMVEKIEWELPKSMSMLLKGDLAFLSMLVANNWERPVCMGMATRKQNLLGLNDYFYLEGLVYRMYPVTSDSKVSSYLHGDINTRATYQKLMYDFLWDGINHTEAGRKVYVQSYFIIFKELAQRLIIQEENEKAEAVLDLYFKIFPHHIKAYDVYSCLLVDQYFQLGKNKKAENIGLQIIENYAKKKPLSDKEQSQLNQLPISKSKVLTDAFNEKIGW